MRRRSLGKICFIVLIYFDWSYAPCFAFVDNNTNIFMLDNLRTAQFDVILFNLQWLGRRNWFIYITHSIRFGGSSQFNTYTRLCWCFHVSKMSDMKLNSISSSVSSYIKMIAQLLRFVPISETLFYIDMEAQIMRYEKIRVYACKNDSTQKI